MALHRYVRHRVDDIGNEPVMYRAARDSSVQVNDMQTPRARGRPALSHSDGIIGEDGLVLHAPLP